MLCFTISAFTHTGFHRLVNQDRISIHRQVISSGYVVYDNLRELQAFVADGVGGGNLGEFSAQFVCEKMMQYGISSFSPQHFREYCHTIQAELSRLYKQQVPYTGSATTLVGAVFHDGQLYIANAGDADARLYRDGIWTEINEKQFTIDSLGYRPITSYFGGNCQSLHLHLSTPVDALRKGDRILLSSDGLWLACTTKDIENILLHSSHSSEEKIAALYHFTQNTDAQDNVSAVWIEVD